MKDSKRGRQFPPSHYDPALAFPGHPYRISCPLKKALGLANGHLRHPVKKLLFCRILTNPDAGLQSPSRCWRRKQEPPYRGR